MLVDPGESTGFQIRLDLHAFLFSGFTGPLYFRPQGRPTILLDRNVGSTCAVGGHARWETFGYASQRKDDGDHHRRRRLRRHRRWVLGLPGPKTPLIDVAPHREPFVKPTAQAAYQS